MNSWRDARAASTLWMFTKALEDGLNASTSRTRRLVRLASAGHSIRDGESKMDIDYQGIYSEVREHFDSNEKLDREEFRRIEGENSKE